MWTFEGGLATRKRQRFRVALAFGCLLWLCLLSERAFAATAPPRLVLQTAHASEVSALRYSADGRIVASASLDGTVRIWRASDGALLAETSAGRMMRRVMTMADDGRIVGIMADGRIIMWDWRTDTIPATISEPDRTASFALSGDGALVYVADNKNGLCLHRLIAPASPAACRQVPPVTAMLATPSALITGSLDGRVLSWPVDLSGPAKLLFTHGSRVTTFRLVAGTRRLVIGGDGYMDEIDVANGAVTATRQLGSVAANVLTISPDGEYIASGMGTILSVVNDIRILKWKADPAGGFKIAGHDLPVTALAFSPHGDRLASGSIDSRVRLWSVKNCLEADRPPCAASPTFSDPPKASQVVTAIVDANGRSFAVVSARWIATFDFESGLPNFVADIGRRAFFADAAFSSDGAEIVSVSTDGLLERRSETSGAVLGSRSFHNTEGIAPRLAAIPRLSAYAVSTVDGAQLLSKTFQTLPGLRAASHKIYEFAVSPDAGLLVQSTADETTLIDLPSDRVLRLNPGPLALPAIAPDRSQVAGAVRDHQAWDAGTLHGDSSEATLVQFGRAGGDPVHRTQADEPISSVAYTPDSRQLVYGTEKGTVTVLDSLSHHVIRAWTAHSGTVVAANAVPGRPVLITASSDGTVKLWSSRDFKLLATVVIFATGDWIAISPSGFFDGTRAAWKLARMSFPDDPTRLYAPEQFFSQFFQPGLIADVSREGQDIAAILNSKGDPRSSLDIAAIRRASPAKVALSGSIGHTGKASIDLVAEGAGYGARDCVVSRNGVSIANPENTATGTQSFRLRLSIDLLPGPNRISAYCFNDLRMKSVDAQTTLTRGAASGSAKGMAYVLAIGVDHYRGLYHDLRYARADAQRVASDAQAALLSTRKYGGVRSVVLTDGNASRQEVLKAIDILTGAHVSTGKGDVLAPLAALRPQDALILYFSGHGVVVDREFYAISYPTMRSKQMTQNVSASDLRQHLEPAQTGDILLVLDTCSSGAALQGEDERAGPLDSRGLIQLAYEKDMNVLAATQPDSVAYERSALKHGLLTYALAIEGLSEGKAYDGRTGGRTTTIDLMKYVSHRVADLQRRHMLDAAARGQLVAYVPGEAKLPPIERGVQRPKFFFRDDPEDQPMLINIAPAHRTKAEAGRYRG